MEEHRAHARAVRVPRQARRDHRRRRIRVAITVEETPAWANRGRGEWVPPDDPADYAGFVGMLARRYAGRVTAWEIWNEPDLPLFWQPRPDPVAYARLLIP